MQRGGMKPLRSEPVELLPERRFRHGVVVSGGANRMVVEDRHLGPAMTRAEQEREERALQRGFPTPFFTSCCVYPRPMASTAASGISPATQALRPFSASARANRERA